MQGGKAEQGYTRIAIITGASSGIGEATARKFVAAGYAVIGNARHADKLHALEQELGAAFRGVAGDAGEDECGLVRDFGVDDAMAEGCVVLGGGEEGALVGAGGEAGGTEAERGEDFAGAEEVERAGKFTSPGFVRVEKELPPALKECHDELVFGLRTMRRKH